MKCTLRSLFTLFPLLVATSGCTPRLYSERSAASVSSRVKTSRHIRTPLYLTKGDTIALLNISSKGPAAEDTLASQRFASWGVHVIPGEHLYDQDGGWFSTSDQARGGDLQAMLDHPSVKAIIFYRGGYGAIRVIDRIDWRSLKRHPKWLVGYSDLTAVHYAANRVGVETIHATMPISFCYDSLPVDPTASPALAMGKTASDNCPDSSALSLRDALFGTLTSYHLAPHPLNRYGKACGRLTGGNLSLIQAVAGTDLDNDLRRPSVLLLEEVGESLSHIDRMLQNLKRSGKLDRVKALLVGHFTGCSGSERFGKTPYELIAEYAEALDIPVIFNFPAGHEAPNFACYMGRTVHISVDEQGAIVDVTTPKRAGKRHR